MLSAISDFKDSKRRLPSSARHRERLLDTKIQQRFTWYVYLLALGHYLNRAARTSADRGSDGRALAPTRDCTDDCPSHGRRRPLSLPCSSRATIRTRHNRRS